MWLGTVRSREMHWRCCHCWSDSWKWNSVAKCWRCVKCYGVDFVEVSSPVQQPLSEHDVSALASGRLPATAFGPPPSDDGPDGGERGESEHGTNDPVVDPDTLQTTPNRRRRRRPKTPAVDSPDIGNGTVQLNVADASRQDRILDLLSQLVSNLSNDRRRDEASDVASWTSRRGPERGVRWRGGTPPAPPVWIIVLILEHSAAGRRRFKSGQYKFLPTCPRLMQPSCCSRACLVKLSWKQSTSSWTRSIVQLASSIFWIH